MTLKGLCSRLAKKPLSLDVMLLFNKPITILHPLCELLDNWRYEEDQGEYQPVYEEFGSVLLLVLAFVYRYNLSTTDLGIVSSDSFVAKFMNVGHLNKPLGELTEQEVGYLAGWVHGLFDSESGGLTDELLSSSPLQDFYLLIPTLFHHVVLAFGTGCLDEESLKTGVECMFQINLVLGKILITESDLANTFLLPSLVPAMMHMSNLLWIELHNGIDQKAVIRLLQLILLTKQSSSEAQAMLSSVLNITAIPLEHSLRSYQRYDPKSQAVEPLLKSIRDNIQLSRRTASATHNELELWSSTATGGLVDMIRTVFKGFVAWGVHPDPIVMPTSYSHRQILTALKMLGARRLLGVILEEVKDQTEKGNGSTANDVATALISAPDVTSMPPPSELSLLVGSSSHPVMPPQRNTSLRGALKWEAEDCKKIHKSDPLKAEIIVRLYRKVEAQLLLPENTETMLQGDINMDLSENAAALGDALAAAAQSDGLGPDDGNMSLDLGGNDMGHLGGNGAGDAGHHGSLDFGPDNDMFSSLNAAGSGDPFEGWDLS